MVKYPEICSFGWVVAKNVPVTGPDFILLGEEQKVRDDFAVFPHHSVRTQVRDDTKSTFGRMVHLRLVASRIDTPPTHLQDYRMIYF